MKCGEHKKTWHRRWFILGPDCLGYFESDLSVAPLGTFADPPVCANAVIRVTRTHLHTRVSNVPTHTHADTRVNVLTPMHSHSFAYHT